MLLSGAIDEGLWKHLLKIIISFLLLHLPSVICRPVQRVEMNTSQKWTGGHHLSTFIDHRDKKDVS